MLEKIKIKKLNKKVDDRGWFLKILDGTEEFRKNLIGDLYFVYSQDGGIRGNHYHKITNEWFCLIKGNCELYLKDIETNIEIKIKLTENEPVLVFVPNMIAHTFHNILKEDFIVMAITDQLFDTNDTLKYDLINN